MALEDLPQNLRLLCSYGRSTSEVCRRLKINRQQFSKYLNGHTQPSLQILRRICDFFGVDEAEILMNYEEFSKLIRLRPPVLSHSSDPFTLRMEKVIRRDEQNTELLERHAGYYYIYYVPDPARDVLLRSVGYIFSHGRDWFVKEVERYEKNEFATPSQLKFSGIAFEAHNRIVITTREQGVGMSMSSTMLIASDYDQPTFLPGVFLALEPEGSHSVFASHVIWEYLGPSPNLRETLSDCGVFEKDSVQIPEFVRNSKIGQNTEDSVGISAYF